MHFDSRPHSCLPVEPSEPHKEIMNIASVSQYLDYTALRLDYCNTHYMGMPLEITACAECVCMNVGGQ